MLVYGSLFSGIGGFDLALDRAGFRAAWQVERDDACQRVLARHWPNVERFDDVNRVRAYLEPRNARRFAGVVRRVDLLCGGFPCQDLSVAGKRAGLAGSRSGLWFTFRRLVGLLRPRWVLIENVPGLLSSNRGRDLGTILGSLGKLGYGWAYRCFDAQYSGLAQRRVRVFIVGCAGDRTRAAQVLFEPSSCDGDSPPSREAGTRVAPGVTPGARRASGNRGGEQLAVTLRSRNSGPGINGPGRGGEDDHNLVVGSLTAHHGRNADGDAFIAHTLKAEGADASEDGTGRGVPLVPISFPSTFSNQNIDTDCAGTLHYQPHAVGVPYIVNAAESCAVKDHARQSDVARCLDVTGGFASNQGGTVVAFHERRREGGRRLETQADAAFCLESSTHAGGGGRHQQVAAGMAVRRLTPLECERLQGFPDGWTAGESDSARYRMLGNAVAVPPAEWIVSRIMEAANAKEPT